MPSKKHRRKVTCHAACNGTTCDRPGRIVAQAMLAVLWSTQCYIIQSPKQSPTSTWSVALPSLIRIFLGISATVSEIPCLAPEPAKRRSPRQLHNTAALQMRRKKNAAYRASVKAQRDTFSRTGYWFCTLASCTECMHEMWSSQLHTGPLTLSQLGEKHVENKHAKHGRGNLCTTIRKRSSRVRIFQMEAAQMSLRKHQGILSMHFMARLKRTMSQHRLCRCSYQKHNKCRRLNIGSRVLTRIILLLQWHRPIVSLHRCRWKLAAHLRSFIWRCTDKQWQLSPPGPENNPEGIHSQCSSPNCDFRKMNRSRTRFRSAYI